MEIELTAGWGRGIPGAHLNPLTVKVDILYSTNKTFMNSHLE